MRCSKMAMRRNRETRTAVAAKPKEMTLAFEGASASLASGCDGVSAPAIPTHGRDFGPASPLMACLATRPLAVLGFFCCYLLERANLNRGNAGIRDG
jgi:hypothetical protein